ncbi:MAG: hypothetical protein SGARI_005824, partial [Bacillariaceae sp.]
MQKESTLHLVLRLRAGMLHQTSGRNNFTRLSFNGEPDLIDVLLPNGNTKQVEICKYGPVSDFAQKAAECYRELSPVDRMKLGLVGSTGVKRKRNDDDNTPSGVEAQEDKIQKLREALREAESEKERLLSKEAQDADPSAGQPKQ